MSTPTERGIIMTGESVRGILDGRKTKTRRVAKPQPGYGLGYVLINGKARPVGPDYPDCDSEAIACPYGVVGDRLWVRETHFILDGRPDVVLLPAPNRPDYPWKAMVTYQADDSLSTIADVPLLDWREAYDSDERRWRSPIHMPRWASRIRLEITDVRVERLHDISESDAKAEGVERCTSPDDVTSDDGVLNAECGYFPPRSYVEGYRPQWDLINGKRDGGAYAWEKNCWVWVLAFSRVSA